MVQHMRPHVVHRSFWCRRIMGWLLAVVLAACGGSDPAPTAETILPGTVAGADGARMEFTPAEGVAATALSIERAEAGAPAMPDGMQAVGAVYRFAPLDHVGSAIEIRVPFNAAQAAGSVPRLLVTLPGEHSWSEIDARVEGSTLSARVPALGYAVAARALSASGTERRLSAGSASPPQYLRGQLSAEPPLQGSGFLLTATERSLLTIRFDYSFRQSCAGPVQLRLRAVVARGASPTLPFSLRSVDLGSRALTALAGSESFVMPLTAANNGAWFFLADARCVEQGRVRFGVATTLPVLTVRIASEPPPPVEGSATIGAAGGFVTGPEGVRLAIPPGALESEITFRISRDSSGAPPLPAGIDLASAVYAITPHGQAFAASASVELPVSATLAAGRPTFLMKAEPGGRWSVIASDSGTAATLRAGVDSLSYLAVGVCQNNLPAGSVFAQACPSSNQLRLELLLNGTTPVPVSQDTTYGAPIPVVLITTPETLTFRMTWTRPAGTNRVDTLDTGNWLIGSTVDRQSGFTFAPTAPRSEQVNENNFSRTFTVVVDPTRVGGASNPNGVVRRIWAQSAFAVTGPGNVGSANWEFNAWVPIRVRSLGSSPVINSQPANVGVTEGQPASFSVAASVSPATTLSYQWSRRASASDPFTLISGANAASFTVAAAQLTDNGAQFRVEVCAVPSLCVASNPATLTVTQVTVAPAFSAQPVDQTIVAGQTATFSAIAAGVPLPQVKWQQAAAGSAVFTDIVGAPSCGITNPAPGATSVAASCTVGPLAVADSGQRVRAVALNAAVPAGVPSNAATVTVTPALVAPFITSQPSPQVTTVGGAATFSVVANGTASLSYGWTVNGSALPSVGGSFTVGSCSGKATYSAGGSSVTLSELSAGCEGVVIVIAVTVSNGINPSAVSNGAGLTVNPAPTTAGICFAGQSNWCYAKPLPQANGLNGLSYRNGTFTAVGGAGTTLRTDDNGDTWQAAFEARRSSFFDVASPAPGLLVAAGRPANALGQNSGVFTSTDGGQTWTRRLDAGFPNSFAVTKLAFANASLGLAAGGRGVWRTVDGGLSWAPVPLPAADFVVGTDSGGVVWADGSTALIFGGQGTILRSADAGLTWTNVSAAGLTATYNDMAFNSVGIGIAVGPSGQVVRSTDFGATWQAVSTGTSGSDTAVAFADDATVVMLGDGSFSQFARSTDAGQTWSVGSLGDVGSSIYRLRFANASVGLAVSAMAGQALRTVDGGQTWSRIAGGTFDEAVTGVATSPSGSVVLAGSLNRSLLRSTSAGATWTSTGASYQRPSFGTEQLAIAIRPSGQIARSTDAGQTWNVVYSQSGSVTLENTTMASATVGLVVGGNGLILRTADGGATWAQVASGTTLPLKSVGCLTVTVCLAGGSDGALLRSTDGGLTWAGTRLPVRARGDMIRSVARFNDTTAVLAVDDGLWRSVDAGLTWALVYAAAQGSQQGASFNPAGIGIAVGYDGILRSTDQGQTWTRQNVPISFILNAVAWINANTVLVAGDGGAILRNLQAGAE